MQKFEHIPVLFNEVMEGLKINPDGVYADGTLGGAGHSSGICERLSEKGVLIGTDQDEDAIKAASERLRPYKCVKYIIRDNYSNLKTVIENLGYRGVDGVLLDIGTSSYQFDTPERGFSYRYDAPLDMRMDRRSGLSAYDVVNGYSKSDLYRIIRDYGEERFAENIAKHIVQAREEKPVETTFELVDIIKASVPMKFRKHGGHPAKKTFQALRIEVNNELGVLEGSIGGLIDILNPGGRLCIITFHSLEDRIVKRAFKAAADPNKCPDDYPVYTGLDRSEGKLITRHPVVPSENEADSNPRSRSAKLRIFEKA